MHGQPGLVRLCFVRFVRGKVWIIQEKGALLSMGEARGPFSLVFLKDVPPDLVQNQKSAKTRPRVQL